MITRRTFVRAAAAAGAASIGGRSWAQGGWPTKPVKVINPFPAGGGTDVFLRPVAARLAQALGQQFTVENLGGAGGTVGAAQAAKAQPDGYTRFCGAVHHAIAESLYTKLPYSLEKDFIPITVLAYVPNVLVVHPKYTGINTLAEFMAYVKKNPGKMNFASAGDRKSTRLNSSHLRLSRMPSSA